MFEIAWFFIKVEKHNKFAQIHTA